MFQCQIMVPTSSLVWSLPNGDRLSFNVLKNVGDVLPSSDDVYSANLTEKRDDGVANTDKFLFTSTLLVIQPVNGSNLTCGGATAEGQVENSTTIKLSGT